MSKKEINRKIIAEVRNHISARGLNGKLDVVPVENVFTRRPRYWNDGNINLFKVHMWDINTLDDSELEREIDARIEAACKHFGL